MRYSPKSDVRRDLGKVIIGLGVDMEQVYTTRKVPSKSCEVIYNQLADLSQVGYKVTDDFDMLMVARGFGSIRSNSGTGSSQDDGSKVVSV